MTNLQQILVEVARDLDECEARWALVGGLAVGARAEPRFTRDIDLAVSVLDDTEAEGIVRHLMRKGYRISALLEQTVAARLATIRLLPPGDDRLLDLLFASSGIEPEIVAQAQMLEIGPGTEAPVARIGHLIAMKILARDDASRPQDRVDLAALLALAGPNELTICREALQQIVDRGFHRKRDLLAELELADATWNPGHLRHSD